MEHGVGGVLDRLGTDLARGGPEQRQQFRRAAANVLVRATAR
jgi:hypothetical protein